MRCTTRLQRTCYGVVDASAQRANNPQAYPADPLTPRGSGLGSGGLRTSPDLGSAYTPPSNSLPRGEGGSRPLRPSKPRSTPATPHYERLTLVTSVLLVAGIAVHRLNALGLEGYSGDAAATGARHLEHLTLYRTHTRCVAALGSAPLRPAVGAPLRLVGEATRGEQLLLRSGERERLLAGHTGNRPVYKGHFGTPWR